jgi:crossover junction endodeoxyribonuclease RusA
MPDDTLLPRPTVSFFVHGTPAPQGSKRGFVNKSTGKVAMVESSKRVKPWKEAVKSAALTARGWSDDLDLTPPMTGPVSVTLTFILPRPKGHFGSGRNALNLTPSAPSFPATTPDLDKLVRSTLDGLTESNLFVDDKQVVGLEAAKIFSGGPFLDPGAEITVTDYT